MRGRVSLVASRFTAVVIFAATICGCSMDAPVPSFPSNSETHPILSRSEQNPPHPSEISNNSIEQAERAVATTPRDVEAWTDLGWLLYKNRRFAEAAWVLDQAKSQQPDDLYVLWLSGLTAYMTGDYAKAKSQLKELWNKDTEVPSGVKMDATYDLLGRIYLNEGDLFTATIFFQHACEIAPNIWQYQFLRGFSQFYRGFYDDAFGAFSAARSLNPNEPIISRYSALAKGFRVIVTVHNNQNDRRFEQSLAGENPSMAWPKNNEQDLALYADAISAVNASIAANPGTSELSASSDIYDLLGRLYFASGQNGEAITAFQKAIAINAVDADAEFQLAYVLLSEPGDEARASAENHLIRSIAISPNYWLGELRPVTAPHLDLLVNLYLEEGRLSEAQTLAAWEREHIHPTGGRDD